MDEAACEAMALGSVVVRWSDTSQRACFLSLYLLKMKRKVTGLRAFHRIPSHQTAGRLRQGRLAGTATESRLRTAPRGQCFADQTGRRSGPACAPIGPTGQSRSQSFLRRAENGRSGAQTAQCCTMHISTLRAGMRTFAACRTKVCCAES